MLCEIRIENVAVIEKATATFGDGFNVLTGETGAGKSILIDSINAILGNRTSRDIVRTGAKKACIWATFRTLSASTKHQLEQAGYDVDDELLLYREISAEGKSTCRINGMVATASVVREICAGLINIHGQHDNQSLLNPAKHLGVLDAFAQNEQMYTAYYQEYRNVCALKRELDAKSKNEQEKEQRIETLRFEIAELERAQLSIDEENELLQRKKTIQNAQMITEKLHLAHDLLNGADDVTGALELIGNAMSALESLASVSSKFEAMSQSVVELRENAQDLANDISNHMDSYEFDAQELNDVEERLDLLYQLKQKYKTDVAGLLAYQEQAEKELATYESSEEYLAQLSADLTECYTAARALADKLTKTRLKAFASFQKQLTQALAFLNMPNISFELSHQQGALTSHGQDSLEFYVSTNSGEAPKPLAKIASGGELSRMMLAMKSALADKDDIATVIYDEIDTGVSGLAAARIGEKLQQTAQGRQVICITHIAQIAARAHVHLRILKNVTQEKTFTQIDSLTQEMRVQEVARMISGDDVTPLALANAKEMLLRENT